MSTWLFNISSLNALLKREQESWNLRRRKCILPGSPPSRPDLLRNRGNIYPFLIIYSDLDWIPWDWGHIGSRDTVDTEATIIPTPSPIPPLLEEPIIIGGIIDANGDARRRGIKACDSKCGARNRTSKFKSPVIPTTACIEGFLINVQTGVL